MTSVYGQYKSEQKDNKYGLYAIHGIQNKTINEEKEEYKLVCHAACIFNRNEAKAVTELFEAPVESKGEYRKSESFPHIEKKDLIRALNVAKKRYGTASFKIKGNTYRVDDDQGGMEHAVHLTNGEMEDGVIVGCSEMTFVLAMYKDNNFKEAAKLVDERMGKLNEREEANYEENQDRWSGSVRMGKKVDFSFDIYSMLMVSTMHAEYVYDLYKKKHERDEIIKKLKNPDYKP